MNKLYIKIISTFSIIIFLILYTFFTKFLNIQISWYNFIGLISTSCLLSSLFAWLYEYRLWRIINLNNVILNNKYNVKIKSSYNNSERTVSVKIKQTFSSVQVIMHSQESKSVSIVSSIHKIDGENKLIYHYRNDPYTEYLNDSQKHYGTAIITIENDGSLKGFYYTDRGTRGDMEFFAVVE